MNENIRAEVGIKIEFPVYARDLSKPGSEPEVVAICDAFDLADMMARAYEKATGMFTFFGAPGYVSSNDEPMDGGLLIGGLA